MNKYKIPEYYHFSRKKLPKKLKDVKQRSRDYKPLGLWFASDNDWFDFYKYEMAENSQFNFNHKFVFFKTNKYYLYDISFDKSKILIIKNLSQLKKFNEKYKYIFKSNNCKLFQMIKWKDVAKKYDGFFISDYHKIFKQLKKHTYPWFSMFDVSSGCLWRMKTVNTELVKKE